MGATRSSQPTARSLATFLSFPGRAVETPSGIDSDHAAGENQAFLYDLEAEGVSSAFELLLQACAAVSSGPGSSTRPSGRWRHRTARR
jgi:hypothetical protein